MFFRYLLTPLSAVMSRELRLWKTYYTVGATKAKTVPKDGLRVSEGILEGREDSRPPQEGLPASGGRTLDSRIKSPFAVRPTPGGAPRI